MRKKKIDFVGLRGCIGKNLNPTSIKNKIKIKYKCKIIFILS